MSEEVAERGKISLTPEVNKPRTGARRNSIGKASSTISPSLSNTDEKPVPNYLRASTGSCHDFCKYGIKHGSETKKRLPISIKFPGNSETSDEGQSQTKALTPQERKKRPDLKSKPSRVVYGHTDEVITPKDLPSEKVIQLSDTPTNQEEGSSGIEMKSSFPGPTTVASLELVPANLAEESFKGSITIKLANPSCIQKSNTPDERKFSAEGLYEEAIRIKSHASNTQKGIAPAEHTPVAQVEEPYVECVITKLVVSLSTRTGIAFAEHGVSNLAVESSEEPEIITSPFQESIASAKHAPTEQAEGSSIQKSIISAEHTSADQAKGLSEEQNQVMILNAGDRKKREVNKLRTSQKKAEISVGAKVIKQKTSEASMEKKAASPATEPITSVKPISTGQKVTSSVHKAIAPLACNIIKQKASSPPKAGDVSAEPATSLKDKESASPSISIGGLVGAEKVLKPLKTCDSTKPPVIWVSSMKLRKFRNMKPSCSMKSQAKVGKVSRSTEKLKAKIPYAIKLKTGKLDQKTIKQKPSKPGSYLSSHSSSSASSLMSSPSVSSHDSRSTLSESVSASDKEGTGQRSKAAVSKGDNKRTPSRSGSIHSEGKSPAPHNLKFRSGRVISLQSESNGPRKLKSRPAKVLRENQNGKNLGRRDFRKQRETGAAATYTPTLDAPAVVLRHQDVQEKKDTQGLLNHVIEETASKLVQTRRSRVKALVGAFETVISLQESKLAPAVAVP